VTVAQPRRPVLWLVAVLALAASALLGLPGAPARADGTQITILEDDPMVLAHPNATLERLRALGVSTLRLSVPWAEVAPESQSTRRPAFDATNPAAYGRSVWVGWDEVMIAASEVGIRIDLDLAPGAPRWATGGGQPRQIKGYPWWQWEPNAQQFGLFAQAMGERYSGNWNPITNRLAPGNPNDLPRVSFWSVWNEPDYGPSLAPQALPGHPGVQDSPRMYRALVDDAWTGLARSGHSVPEDTIIIGELAPRSQLTGPGRFTQFNGMTPMVFLENLYCLSSSFTPLRGQAASLRGCPSTSAGTHRFVADNPALFHNSGISDHPYDEWFAPNEELDIPKLPGWSVENTQDTSLATIGVLERGLDRLTAAYGDHAQLGIWDTEYGYETSPPHRIWAGDKRPWPSPQTAAYYDNWAEYLHWKDPRLKSFAQYLLKDAAPSSQANDYGSFASGLFGYNGVAKGAYPDAFRMPVYMPQTTVPTPYTAVEVWGAARPAVWAINGLGQSETVNLLYQPEGSHSWSLLSTVAVSASGYYDAEVRFPASGTLRAQWIEPLDPLLSLTGTAVESRPVKVTVH
jgi:hypothetical protein